MVTISYILLMEEFDPRIIRVDELDVLRHGVQHYEFSSYVNREENVELCIHV